MNTLHIDESYTGRVRIIGKPGETSGRLLHVYDIETGEEIINVCRAVLILDASKESTAALRFYNHNDKCIAVKDDGEPVIGDVITNNPVVDVTAWKAEE